MSCSSLKWQNTYNIKYDKQLLNTCVFLCRDIWSSLNGKAYIWPKAKFICNDRDGRNDPVFVNAVYCNVISGHFSAMFCLLPPPRTAHVCAISWKMHLLAWCCSMLPYPQGGSIQLFQTKFHNELQRLEQLRKHKVISLHDVYLFQLLTLSIT